MQMLRMSVLIGLALVVCGCAATSYPPPREVAEPPIDRSAERFSPPPRVARTPASRENEPTERTGMALPDDRSPATLTEPRLAEAVAVYMLDELNIAVVPGAAYDGAGLGDELVQRFEEVFTDVGLRVLNAAGQGVDRPDRRGIARLAREMDADLVVFVHGDAREHDRFGNFYLYAATVRASAYNRFSDIVTTREIDTHGDRSTSQDAARRSALLNAADQLAPLTVEQLVRRSDGGMIGLRLTLGRLRNHAEVMQVVEHLRQQPGIADVRLMSWDAGSRTARVLLYMRPGTRGNIGVYLRSVPGLQLWVSSDDVDDVSGMNVGGRP